MVHKNYLFEQWSIWELLIRDIMQNFGRNSRTLLFMKIHPAGPIVDLETSNMAHFLGNYLGQVFQALIWVGRPIGGI